MATEPTLYGARRGPGRTRAMVLRHYLAGLPSRSIAAKVGISVQAVNKHLRNLRADGELPEEGAA